MEVHSPEVLSRILKEDDELIHLQWDNEENYDRFLLMVSEVLLKTNWYNNWDYELDDTISTATQLSIVGLDAGVFGAILIRNVWITFYISLNSNSNAISPTTSNMSEWMDFYKFALITYFSRLETEI